MEQQLIRPEGFSIFRYMQYLDCFPYVAIGLFAAAIIFWIVFKIMRTRWTKIIAVTLTVLTIIAGILSFIPYMLDDYMGGQFPGERGGQFQDMTPEEREQFFQERQQSESASTGLDESGASIYYRQAV